MDSAQMPPAHAAGRRRSHLTPGRVEAFSDGIFAIAATLLILNVQVARAPAGQLTRQLLDLWPSYVAYATSFITIAVMWLNHHAIFSRVAHVDRPLVVFNLFMLGLIAFLPFPTQVLGTHIGTPQDATAAALLYAVTGILIALGFGGVYLWLATHPALLHEQYVGVDFLRVAPRYLVGSIAYAACIPLAFIYPPAVVAVIAAIILYYSIDQLPQPKATDPTNVGSQPSSTSQK